MKQDLVKIPNGWEPANEKAISFHKKAAPGGIAHGDFSMVRNPGFHRKYFALLNIGFLNWQPEMVETRWGLPVKDFDTFREIVTILGGHRELVFRLNGEPRMKAKSISFANMEEPEFRELYSKTIDVLIKNVYGSEKMTPEGLDDIVMQYLSFV